MSSKFANFKAYSHSNEKIFGMPFEMGLNLSKITDYRKTDYLYFGNIKTFLEITYIDNKGKERSIPVISINGINTETLSLNEITNMLNKS